MPLKHVYIDESLSSGGGGQSVSDPYSSLALALSSESQNTSGGTQFNIKSVSSGGASVVQSTSTDLTTQITWTPNFGDPVIFRGYDTGENDGGTFDWDLDGRSTTLLSKSHVSFVDGKIHNSGTMPALTGFNYALHFVNIHFDSLTSTSDLIRLHRSSTLVNCYLSNLTTGTYNSVVKDLTDANYVGNYFDATSIFAYYLLVPGVRSVVQQNIFVVPSERTSTAGVLGVVAAGAGGESNRKIQGNSFLKLGKTQNNPAVKLTGTAFESCNFTNNLFEGFVDAVDIGSDARGSIYAGNSFYDNTNDINYDSMGLVSTQNETLTSSPFEKSGSLSFANRAQYFAPADVGNVRTGGYSPHGASGITRGAIPFAGTGGTGGSQHPLFASRSHPLLNS